MVSSYPTSKVGIILYFQSESYHIKHIEPHRRANSYSKAACKFHNLVWIDLVADLAQSRRI